MEYKNFKRKGDIFQTKRMCYSQLIFGLVFLAVGIWVIISAIPLGQVFKQWYWIILLIGGVYNLSFFAQQLEINVASGMLTKSYFGLFKKEIPTAEIASFKTLRHMYLFLHNGTDVIFQLRNTANVTALSHIWQVEGVIADIKAIISNEVNQQSNY